MSHISRGAARSELVSATIRSRGYGKFCARGGSMNPWVRDGDVVLVQRATAGQVRPGDVVAFERCGGIFAHRLLARHGSTLITKGDALPFPDSPLAAEELLGQVVGVVRGDRTVSFQTLARRSLGRLLAGASAFTDALYLSVRALKRMIGWIHRPAENRAIPSVD